MAAAVPPSDVAPPWLTSPPGVAFAVAVDGGAPARGVRVLREDELGAAAEALELAGPVLVVVGGAGKMERDELDAVEPVIREALAPFAQAQQATVVDGGTDAGVMRLNGSARANATFALVGVVPAALVASGDRDAKDAAELERHHTHFLFVPGSSWGDESRWLARFAGAIAAGRPSATVLLGGGDVSVRDAEESVAEGRPVLAVTGTGRAADKLASAPSQLIRPVDADPRAVRTALDELFERS